MRSLRASFLVFDILVYFFLHLCLALLRAFGVFEASVAERARPFMATVMEPLRALRVAHSLFDAVVSAITVRAISHYRGQKENIVKAKMYYEIVGDDSIDTARNSVGVIKKFSENQIIFGGNYFTEFLPPSRCWVVWDKQNTGHFADAELAWTSFPHGVKLYHFMWNGLAREGDRKSEGITRVHPTQKPVGLIENILADYSEEGDTVLDTFGGSGSTLIACEKSKRHCRMMELSPEYCDVIRKRWAEFVHGEGCDWEALTPEAEQ